MGGRSAGTTAGKSITSARTGQALLESAKLFNQAFRAARTAALGRLSASRVDRQAASGWKMPDVLKENFSDGALDRRYSRAPTSKKRQASGRQRPKGGRGRKKAEAESP